MSIGQEALRPKPESIIVKKTKPISAQERRRRAQQRKERLDQERKNNPALLYPRRITALKLNVSVATVRRLEAKGMLDKVRLTPNGPVHHRAAQVHALAQEDFSSAG